MLRHVPDHYVMSCDVCGRECSEARCLNGTPAGEALKPTWLRKTELTVRCKPGDEPPDVQHICDECAPLVFRALRGVMLRRREELGAPGPAGSY